MFLVDDHGVKKNGKQYMVEYILIFEFAPPSTAVSEGNDGKITAITEFQDSAYVNGEFEGWYKEG